MDSEMHLLAKIVDIFNLFMNFTTYSLFLLIINIFFFRNKKKMGASSIRGYHKFKVVCYV